MASGTIAAPAKPLILTQMATRLHEIFDGLIDLSGVAGKPDEEQYFLTRSYLALFFVHEAGLTPTEAANCITDGGADDGVDAVFVDRNNARIYFGQSKWRSNMSKGVELADFTRFRDGVKKVLTLSWTAENDNLHKFSKEIEEQLRNINTNVIMILAHTSGQTIAGNILAKISEYLQESNKYNADFVSFSEFRVPEAAKIARSHARPENINLPVMLAQWGLLTGPYRSVYGSLAATDVVSWYEDHGNKLFAENIRYGIEKSEVNDGIMSTAHGEPESFWYYNNGITAICDSVLKQPIGGPDTASGVFDVRKISVINGAQTITSLARAKHAGADLSRVRVHLRIISLSDTPEEFATSVTNANNTQNDLNPVDFVAGDPNQERLRREADQIGVVYTFRRGDKEPDRAQGFTIRAATVAAACASGDLRLASAAKRYISALWESTKKEPYTKLFNSETTAISLWRAVRMMNSVDDLLQVEGDKLTDKERLIAVHGNRFILFYVFSKIGRTRLQSDENIADLESAGKLIATDALARLRSEIPKRFPDAYPGNIFKNQERQTELLETLP